MKKTLFFVVIILILFYLISCSTGSDDTKAKDNDSVRQEEVSTGTPDEPGEEIKLLPNVPEDLNLNGYKFRILYELSEGLDWGMKGIEAEEQTGDVINDAAYIRNAYVTDKYNFEISGTIKKPYALDSAAVKKIVQSGSDDYDAVIIRQGQIPALITSGCLIDFNNIPGLDFDRLWWDKSIMNQMTVSGRKFTAFGDFIVTANDALRIMMFNKKLHQENGLENVYALVKEGKWTLDKFYAMSKDIAMDLNGDGKMDTNDRYGLLIQKGCVPCFMFGSGEFISSKTKEDIPFLTIGSERSLLVLHKIYDIVNTQNLVIYDQAFPKTWEDLQVAFENNQGLFFGEVLNLVERMRATETEFGILPFPKYDETQKDYYTFSDSWCTNHIIIPSTNQNLLQSGQVLEILCAESYYTMRPAYYDKSLNGKFIRDEESSEMLDIILANKVIALDEMYGWGMYTAINTALSAKSADFASAIEKTSAKAENQIQKTVDSIENIE